MHTLLTIIPILFAFNPPVEESGPVRLSFQLEEIKQEGIFFLEIKNSGAGEIFGTIKLKATSPWKISPDKNIKLTVDGNSKKTIKLSLRAEGKIFPEFYSISAKGEFTSGKQRIKLNPIAIFTPDVKWPETKLPLLNPITGKVPEGGGSLAGLGICNVKFFTFSSGKKYTMPQGWEGSHDETGCHFDDIVSIKRGRRTLSAIAFHPPWRKGAGRMFIDFPLELPSTPMKFEFYIAIRDNRESEPPSDGVNFEVSIGDPKNIFSTRIFSRHSKSKEWEKCICDLSEFAGKKITLRLTADPGPEKDTTCDQGYFGELALKPVIAGKIHNQQHTENFSGLKITKGKIGIWDSVFEFLPSKKSTHTNLSFSGFKTKLLLPDGREINPEWFSKKILWKKKDKELQVIQSLTTGGEITCRIQALANTFSFSFESTGGELLETGPGPFNKKARLIYAGPGNVISEPEAFSLGGDGHRFATRFAGFDFPETSLVMATDIMPERLEVFPDRNIYRIIMGENPVFTFTSSSKSVFDALRKYRTDIAEKQESSTGIKKLKGRFVFDLWGGKYRQSADLLNIAAKYGLTHSVVVWHNWQRWGYDYRLPEIFPPNPRFGTRDDFRYLAATCKKQGILFAPHDNYIDIYPDFEDFSYKHVCMRKNGRPVRAWFNRGRNAQSYRFRPDTFLPFLKENVKLLTKDIAPTAYFIDVFSSIGFFAFYDSAGNRHTRRETRARWAESFNWIRDHLGGNAPQISESGHDGLIGSLDGAQTNHLRVDASSPKWTWKIKCKDTERIPWFDFVWHDKFVLHGAGYPSRYAGSLPLKEHGWQSDDYISTEVLTGHPGMVSRPLDSNVIRKYFLWHDFADFIGLERLEDVVFLNGDLHTQKVTYANGAEVIVNRGKQDLELPEKGFSLPQYGFSATAKGHEAAIARREGGVVEWSKGPGFFYANSRPEKTQLKLAGKTVDFGFCKTNGAFLLKKQGETWTLTPLPGNKTFEVFLPFTQFPGFSSIKSAYSHLISGEKGRKIRTVHLKNGLKIVVPENVFTCQLGE